MKVFFFSCPVLACAYVIKGTSEMTQSFLCCILFVVVPVGFALGLFGLTHRHSHARRFELTSCSLLSVVCAYMCAGIMQLHVSFPSPSYLSFEPFVASFEVCRACGVVYCTNGGRKSFLQRV